MNSFSARLSALWRGLLLSFRDFPVEAFISVGTFILTILSNEEVLHSGFPVYFFLPLLIGCDMADMDAFTVGLLSNTEVLDVNQDPLGIQGMPVERDDKHAVYLKPLEDGSVALGFFNLTTSPLKLGFKPRALGIEGTQILRDLWRQKDRAIIEMTERWETTVPGHGVVLLKVVPAKP